jgi:hypothetical protein
MVQTFGKRGQGFKIFNYSIFRMMFFTIFFSTVYLFTTSQLKAEVNTGPIQEAQLLSRLLYSPNALVATDEITSRTYAGILDMERINSKNNILDKAFERGNAKIAAKIQITLLDGNTKVETYVNKKEYDRWAPLVKFSQYEKSINKVYVLVKDGDVLKPGLMRVDVVVAK